MYEVTYFGFSVRFLKELMSTDSFVVKGVVVEKARITTPFKEFIEHNNLEFYILETKESLNHIEDFLKTDIIIVHKFGYIIPEHLTRKYNIFNIHSGSLRTNRGAHPLIWSILLEEKETCMSLYKLNEKVDLGLCISEYHEKISNEDNTVSLSEKLEKGYSILLNDLYRFLNGEIEGWVISEGYYRPKVQRKDYTIDLINDSYKRISSKIRSQKAYKGAVLRFSNEDYYVISVDSSLTNENTNSITIDMISEELIVVKRDREKLFFKINNLNT